MTPYNLKGSTITAHNESSRIDEKNNEIGNKIENVIDPWKNNVWSSDK